MVIPLERRRCKVRIKGTDGGYHDCRRGKIGHAGPHGNPVYGDFLPGSPVVRKNRGGQPGTSCYSDIGQIGKDGKVQEDVID